MGPRGRGFCEVVEVEGHVGGGGRADIGQEVLGVVEADGAYRVQGVGNEACGVAGAASEVCSQLRAGLDGLTHEGGGCLGEGLREE